MGESRDAARTRERGGREGGKLKEEQMEGGTWGVLSSSLVLSDGAYGKVN